MSIANLLSPNNLNVFCDSITIESFTPQGGNLVVNGTSLFNGPSIFYPENTINSISGNDSFFMNTTNVPQQLTHGHTIIGFGAGSNIGPLASSVTAIGTNAANSLVSADGTFIGNNAGSSITIQDGNVCLGQSSGKLIQSVNNTCLGHFSGAGITSGAGNISVAVNNGRLTMGNNNVVMGIATGPNGIGNNNILLGNTPGFSITSNDNICLGRGSGGNDTLGGGSNTYIGLATGMNLVGSTYTHSTALGANSIITASNQIQLGEAGIDNVNVGNKLSINTLQLTDAKGHLCTIPTAPPTISLSAGAGTGATFVLSNATDLSGQISVTTSGTPLANSIVFTITFNKSYDIMPNAVLFPANLLTSTLASGLFFNTSSTVNVSFNSSIALATGQTYKWTYSIMH